MPRTISSCVLVSSRHTTARRSGAEHLDGVLQAGREPPRRLEEHGTCAARPPAPASHVLRAECLRGAKPSKQNRSAGSPETASAVVTADGPGRQLTGNPASHAGRHQPVAGVVDHRHARVADHQHRRAAPDLVDQRGHPRRLVLVEQADDLARDPDVQRLRQRPDPAGVLGGDHIGAAQGADQPGGGVGGQPQRRGRQQQSTGSSSPHSLRSVA